VLFVFAVIETGGKQYKVSEGDIIFVEKLGAPDGAEVIFDKVLAIGAETFTVGAPYVEGASVAAKIVKNGKAKKITVFTYKPKKNEKRKMGHRQPYTKVEISAINA
jgi:large subunit ribosomal protein L21